MGSSRKVLIFCDFNHLTKVDPQIFSIWMNILKRVPNSIMWFLRLPKEAEANLKKEAELRGVDPDRILFTDMLPLKDHLIVKSMCQLFLDTVVFNAHGTGMDILWAGVPIITKMGETFQSRAAGSYVNTLGCPEMVVNSLEEYEERAVEWALDAQAGGTKLKNVRKKLEENRLTSPLFDTRRYIRDWENAMELIWKIHAEGDKPRHVTVPQEPWLETILDRMDLKESNKFWHLVSRVYLYPWRRLVLLFLLCTDAALKSPLQLSETINFPTVSTTCVEK